MKQANIVFLVLFFFNTAHSQLPTYEIDPKDKENSEVSIPESSRVGIRWSDELNWQQAKLKAKAENKYIFVDCFASWCAPCKRMDDYVYSDSNVGSFFNEKFISLKIQMDQTSHDNDNVKKWYETAKFINSEYKIIAYPSFLIFSPSGKLIFKDQGFKTNDSLIALAQTAVKTGEIYRDPYLEYDKLVNDYRRGKKNYKKIPFMVEKAKKIRAIELVDSLVKDYYQYLGTQSKRNLLTKTNIGLIADNIKSRKDRYFSLFYHSKEKVDSIMQKRGFARATVDRIIKVEEIDPVMHQFYEKYSYDQVIAGAAPNWKAISDSISGKYEAEFAARAIRAMKVDFYWFSQQKPSYIQAIMNQMNNNDLDTSDSWTYIVLNTCSWLIFETSNSKDTIDIAIGWMEEVLRRKAFQVPALPIDTYANLLYKMSMLNHADRYREAIEWEKKAVKDAIEKQFYGNAGSKLFQERVNKMEKRIPTWPIQ